MTHSAGFANDRSACTETVDLGVVHNADGSMSVQLNEIDFETGTRTSILQTIQNAANSAWTPGITDKP